MSDQFESWFEEHTGWDAEDYPNKYLLDVCWEAWQASREALKAEQGQTVQPIAWLNDAYLARGVVDGEAGDEDAGPGYIPVYREAFPSKGDGWIACADRMPEEGGRYWCYVEEQNSLGKSHYQWNCSWNGDEWGGEALSGRVSHWMPLPLPPSTNHPIDTTPNQYDALGKGGEQ